MRAPWKKAETELDREVQYHLESLADAYERQGLSRAEAMREARREFGGVESIKEQCRAIRWWHPLAEAAGDIRFGWRMMRRAPAITGAALLSLALGIGATTAMLSLADVLLWRRLGVPQPEQLSEVFWAAKQRTGLDRRSVGSVHKDGALMVADFFSTDGLEALRAASRGRAEIAAQMGTFRVSASYEGRLNLAEIRPVSGNFFAVLGVQPALGRILNERDDTATAAPAVVLSHRFWMRRLGGDPTVVGRRMRINNGVYEIAGVTPAQFTGIVPGDDVELYSSIWQSPQFLAPDSNFRPNMTDPSSWWLHPIARRAAGVSVEQLGGVLDAGFAASWPKKPETAEATPHIRLGDASRGLGSIRRGLGNPVLILLGLVVLVLAAACANIANLMLARAASREKEVALRISLGCGRGRLLRQFLTESLLLASMGGVLSLPVAVGLLSMLGRFTPIQGSMMVIDAAPDVRSLAGTALVTILSALLFGLYPSWRAVGVDAGPALKEVTGHAAVRGRSRWAAARLLVVSQVSLGVVLVTAAVLFVGNLWNIVHRETGFERDNTILFSVRPGELGYTGAGLKRFYLALERRLAEVPGVRREALSMTRPMAGGGWEDIAHLPGGVATPAGVHHVTGQFLDALRIPITAGRMLTRQEIEGGERVAVVSEAFAAQLRLPSPLGVHFTMDVYGAAPFEIVGVARNATYVDLRRTSPVVYLPFDYEAPVATVVAGTSIAPLGLLPAIRAAAAAIHSDAQLVDVYTMEQQISRTLQRERLFAWLCGSFGVLALVLCVVGLYGLMAHMTARRTQEIGVRMAMGATRGDIARLSLGSGLRLTLGGLMLGVPPAVAALAFAGRQGMIPKQGFPYGSLAAALGVIAVVAALAVVVPALRAATVDPARALRQG